MQRISNQLQPHLFDNSKKVDYEFEAVCLEMEKALGGRENLLETEKARIWSMPHKLWFTENKAWQAIDIMKKRGKKSVGYLEGIIKKLK